MSVQNTNAHRAIGDRGPQRSSAVVGRAEAQVARWSKAPAFAILLLNASALLVIVNLTSCRTLAPIPLVNQQSQIINQQLRLDSIYHYEKDSMAISFRPAVFLAAASPLGAIGVRKDSLEQTSGGARSAEDICGTTTFRTDDLTAAAFPRDTLVIERWHTRFKDHEVVKTDTLKVTEYQTITETQKYIPRFYKWCTLFFWMLIILFLGYLIFRIMKAIYLRQ